MSPTLFHTQSNVVDWLYFPSFRFLFLQKPFMCPDQTNSHGFMSRAPITIILTSTNKRSPRWFGNAWMKLAESNFCQIKYPWGSIGVCESIFYFNETISENEYPIKGLAWKLPGDFAFMFWEIKHVKLGVSSTVKSYLTVDHNFKTIY